MKGQCPRINFLFDKAIRFNTIKEIESTTEIKTRKCILVKRGSSHVHTVIT